MKLSVNGRFYYDVSDTISNTSLTDSLNIIQIIIHNSINKMPNIQVDIETMKRVDYYDKLTDLTLKISSQDSFDLVYPFGIAKIVSDANRSVQLKGYMCKRADFMELGSEYLDESLDKAISALDFRDNVNNVDAISGDYWRINETKLECLLRLLLGSKQNSIFNINETDINVIDLSNSNSSTMNEYIPPTEIDAMISSDRFSSTNYSLYDSGEEETANKAVPMFNATWNSLSMVGYEHKDFIANFMSSMIYRYPIKRVVKLIYKNTYIPYNAGESMKLDVNTYGYNNMLILSKNTLFEVAKGNIITELILGTLN